MTERPQGIAPRCCEALQAVRNAVLVGRNLGRADTAATPSVGWFGGPEEVAEVQRRISGGVLNDGAAFGRPWPWVAVDDCLLSPGIPVTLAGEEQGPDGVYRRDGDAVLREAGGRENLVLMTHQAAPSPGAGFDVLWFEDAARFLVRGGAIEIEDLFSRMITPVDSALVEKLLLRRRRCDPAILDHVGADETTCGQTTMEVSRPVAVMAPTWMDPDSFFCQGVGFEKAELFGDRLRCVATDRPGIEFVVETDEVGWRAQACDPQFPFVQLAVRGEAGDVILVGTISESINPLATGMRERLAFDLRSFLVSLGGAGPTDR